ncbi:cupin domain-containing protein [Arthrobacter sp. ATA002]|uniref:cupin domain-containing protein n=1 Tax=Arthrobacter sp. ATA002 TaxID=2991715 RepID=UPI0022A71BCB|nr:cupin domain-containing protein [Arthrobacter sp. ATA002]WAP51553.1 cupin domain-containing protein [Arthrobacter sp. ATA002]
MLPGPGGAPAGFPGGTGVTRINVYTWDAVDGQCGGSPHLHTATTESYVVVAGRGRVQTLSSTGFDEHGLAPGTVLWFTPGTVHRLINDDGALEIVAVMGNSGLPENGDAVLTFPERYLDDPAAYREAAALPREESAEAREAAVVARRDLAMEGFLALRARVEAEGPQALDQLYRQAAALVQDKAAMWNTLVHNGPLAQARQSLAHLEQLAQADGTHLHDAVVRSAAPTSADPVYGMCGRLQTWNLMPSVAEAYTTVRPG